jgi:hypothetical protein
MSRLVKVEFYKKGGEKVAFRGVKTGAHRRRKSARLLDCLGKVRLKPLEFQLCEILSRHCGERGHTEGAVDTLCRIIAERDRAMTLLALDRLKEITL